MSRNLSHVLLASPPYWNTVSQHPTVVDYYTIPYGTGRVVGTVSYTRTSTVSYSTEFLKNVLVQLYGVRYIAESLFRGVAVLRCIIRR